MNGLFPVNSPFDKQIDHADSAGLHVVLRIGL